MKILLDTHIFLWALVEPTKLPPHLRALLEDDDTDIAVSAASAWEVALKYQLGKLPGAANIIADYPGALLGLRAESLAISSLHALKAGAWRSAYRDPFDRMLAAQSTLESLPLATTDSAMRHFEIEVI